MASRRNLASVPDPPDQPERERAPDLRDSVRTALAGMTWLAPTDEAMKALAMRQAEEIEKAVDRAAEFADLKREFGDDISAYKRLQKLEAMCDLTKTVGWLGVQLQGVLRDLGGTPGSRAAMSTDKPIGGRLAQIRRDEAAAAGKNET